MIQDFKYFVLKVKIDVEWREFYYRIKLDVMRDIFQCNILSCHSYQKNVNMHLELKKMTASSTSAEFLSHELEPQVSGRYILHEQGTASIFET